MITIGLTYFRRRGPNDKTTTRSPGYNLLSRACLVQCTKSNYFELNDAYLDSAQQMIVKQEGQHIGATYKSILKVLLKQYRSPTDPNKFKSATIISVDHFQITMRHDLDRWPFDPKINRAHPWLMGSKCMKFHDHRLITESVIVRKPFSNNHAPWPWPLTFWPQNQ